MESSTSFAARALAENDAYLPLVGARLVKKATWIGVTQYDLDSQFGRIEDEPHGLGTVPPLRETLVDAGSRLKVCGRQAATCAINGTTKACASAASAGPQ